MSDIATLSVRITADGKELEAALKRAQAELERANREFAKLGNLRGGGPGPALDRAAIAAQKLATETARTEGQLLRNARAAQQLAAAQERASRVKMAPTGADRTAAEMQRAEAAALRFAQARARLLADSGDLAGAERILQGALNATTQSTTATIAAQRQLLAVQNQIAASAQPAAQNLGQMAGAMGSIQGILGAAGFALGAEQVLAYGAAALTAANSLEKTQALVKSLAGDQETYAEILALATAQQQQFGGSIEPILGSLGRLAPLSRNTGIEIETLNSALQVLAVANPAEGIEGAAYALRSFLTQDGAEAALSLADRFDLNAKSLQALTAAAVPAEQRLAGLFTLLEQQGFTAATVAAQTDTLAASYDRFGGSLSRLQTAVGALLAQGFAPLAQEGTMFADVLARAVESINAGIGPIEALNNATVAGATSYADYRARMEEATAAAQDFISNSQILNNALGANAPIIEAVTNTALGWIDTLFGMSEAEVEAAIATEQNAAAVADATSQYSLAYTATADVAAITQEAGASMDLASVAAAAEADALRDATQAAAEQANAGATLEEQARAAADALVAAGNAGASAAAQLGNSTNPIDKLTAAYYRLAAAQQAARAGTGALGNIGAKFDKGVGEVTATIRALNREFGAGPLAGLGGAPKGGGGGGGGGGGKPKGKGAGGGKSPAVKAAEAEEKALAALESKREDIAEQHQEKLADIEQRAQEARLSAEERYQEDRAALLAKYAKEEQDARESLEQSQLEGRAGFYDSLRGIEDQGIRQRASAAFEEGEARAGQLEQTQGADVAEAYREENAQVVEARARREAEIAKLREEGKKGEAQYLADVDKMYREAENRRLEKIAAGEGSLDDQKAEALGEAEAQRVEALAEAERKRQEALGEAGEAAQKRLADAQEKTAEKVAATNLQLQKQLDLLNKTGGPAAAAPAPAAAAATPVTTAAAAGSPGADGRLAVDAPTVEELLRQAVAALQGVERRLRSQPNYTPGA